MIFVVDLFFLWALYVSFAVVLTPVNPYLAAILPSLLALRDLTDFLYLRAVRKQRHKDWANAAKDLEKALAAGAFFFGKKSARLLPVLSALAENYGMRGQPENQRAAKERAADITNAFAAGRSLRPVQKLLERHPVFVHIAFACLIAIAGDSALLQHLNQPQPQAGTTTDPAVSAAVKAPELPWLIDTPLEEHAFTQEEGHPKVDQSALDAGSAFYFGGDLNQAVIELSEACRRDQDNPMPWKLLGRCYQDNGDWVRGIRAYAHALHEGRLDPRAKEGIRICAQNNYPEKNLEEACVLIAEELKRLATREGRHNYTEETEPLYELAYNTLVASERYKAAGRSSDWITPARRSIEAIGQWEKRWCVLGALRTANQDPRTTNLSRASFYHELARLSMDDEPYQSHFYLHAAIGELSVVTNSNPRYMEICNFELAQQLYAEGRYREAQDTLSSIAQIEESQPADFRFAAEYNYLRGLLSYKSRDFRGAENSFCAASDLFAKSQMALPHAEQESVRNACKLLSFLPIEAPQPASTPPAANRLAPLAGRNTSESFSSEEALFTRAVRLGEHWTRDHLGDELRLAGFYLRTGRLTKAESLIRSAQAESFGWAMSENCGWQSESEVIKADPSAEELIAWFFRPNFNQTDIVSEQSPDLNGLYFMVLRRQGKVGEAESFARRNKMLVKEHTVYKGFTNDYMLKLQSDMRVAYKALPLHQQERCVVQFDIQKDGHFTDIRIVKPSGDRPSDNAALTTFELMGKARALPDQFKQELFIEFTFG